MQNKDPFHKENLPPLLSFIHEWDLYLVHKYVKPVFDLITIWTPIEQWHVVQFLLIAYFIEAVFDGGLCLTSTLVIAHLQINLVYFVVFPLELKNDTALTDVADSRHKITAVSAHFMTGFMFFIIGLILAISLIYLFALNESRPLILLLLTDPDLILLWLVYHTSQWLDRPKKKSIKEEVNQWIHQHMPLSLASQTIRNIMRH